MRKSKLRLSILILLVLCAFVCVLSSCNNDNTVKASYIISFNSKGGTPIDTVYLKDGDSITLPEQNPVRPGYVFTGWYLDNECSQPLNSATFKAKRNLTIFAGWESVETYRHTISVSYKSEFGTIEILSPEDKRARKGDVVTVEVFCAGGYIIKEGSLKANGILLTQSEEKSSWYTFIMPAESVTVSCEFEPEPLSVNIYEYIENGIIIPSAEYASLGDQVTLLIIPDYGYKLKSLYFIGSDAITYIGNVGSFYMGDTAVVIGAEFEPVDNMTKYAITTVAEGAGSIDIDKTQCEAGLYVNVDAVPANGYRLARLAVEYGSQRTLISGQSFVMPADNVTVKAVFVPIGANDNDYVLSLSETQNGSITIINRKNNYKSGENVAFYATPDDGYETDGVYANGSYISGNSFRMPSSDCYLTARFIRTGYSIKVVGTQESSYTSVLSKEKAYPGDRVYIDIIPDDGYTLVKDSLMLDDGTPIVDGSFIMPDYDVEIQAEVIPIDKLYTVTLTNAIGGKVSIERTSYAPYEVVDVTVAPDNGYALKTNGLSISYANETESFNKVIGKSFIMPSSDITILASFERIYAVSAYDNGIISVLPSVSTLTIGQHVSYNINTYGDYVADDIRLSITIGSYSEYLDNSNVFELSRDKCIDGDEILVSASSSYHKTNKINSYKINIRNNSVGGKITTSKNDAVAGTLVTLGIQPDDGFELVKLELSANGSVTSIADVFVMPDDTAEITATFAPKTEENFIFGLKNSYLNNLLSFEALGFKLTYLRTKSQILQYFGDGVKKATGYLNGAIEVKSTYGHDFYLFEVNDMAEIGRLSYILADIVAKRYDGFSSPSVYIRNGYLIISPEGNAEEDWYVYRNKLTKFGNFLIYERENGTYGLFAYTANGGYVSIPKSFNGRTISYVAPYAFRNSADIKGLDLGYVSELDKFALCGLSQITSLELRNVQSIGTGAFKGTASLEAFSISSYNTAYKVYDGVIYDSGATTLIAYPSAKNDETYSLKTQVSAVADYAFYGAKFIKRLGFGSKLAKIGNYAFAECKSISSICHDAISGTTGVADFALNRSSVTTIGDYAFNGASSLNAFNLDTVTYIGKYAFKLEHNGRLNINVDNNRVLPTVYYDVVENATDGSLRITVNSIQNEIYVDHPIWSQYSKLVI